RRTRKQGYRRMDAYTPFPVEGLAQALGQTRRVVPLIVLIAGISGGVGGYFLQWYPMAVDFPLTIGGRPLNSWPAFVPPPFELPILCAAIASIIAMLALNRLPRLHHPIFDTPDFERASTDRFFLCIEAGDPQFDRESTRAFLESLHPEAINEVAI